MKVQVEREHRLDVPVAIADPAAPLRQVIAAPRQPVTVRIADDGRRLARLEGPPCRASDDEGASGTEFTLPPVHPEWLGDRSFNHAHGVRFAYLVGEMARGPDHARHGDRRGAGRAARVPRQRGACGTGRRARPGHDLGRPGSGRAELGGQPDPLAPAPGAGARPGRAVPAPPGAPGVGLGLHAAVARHRPLQRRRTAPRGRAHRARHPRVRQGLACRGGRAVHAARPGVHAPGAGGRGTPEPRAGDPCVPGAGGGRHHRGSRLRRAHNRQPARQRAVRLAGARPRPRVPVALAARRRRAHRARRRHRHAGVAGGGLPAGGRPTW